MSFQSSKRRKTSHEYRSNSRPSLKASENDGSHQSLGEIDFSTTSQPKASRFEDVEELETSGSSPASNLEPRQAPSRRGRHGSTTAFPTSSDTARPDAFALQVDELLREVKPRYRKIKQHVGDTVERLKDVIESIPDKEPLTVDEAIKQMLKQQHPIRIPFPQPKPSTGAKYQMRYSAPAGIEVCGSFPLQIQIKSSAVLGVDLAVEMPSSMFTEKDFLNHRFFYKRSYYLACLAEGIQKKSSELECSVKFIHMHSNQLLPALRLDFQKVNASLSTPCEILIVPVVADGVFSNLKLLPHRNCIRPRDDADAARDETLQPTPIYNSTIRLSACFLSYKQVLQETLDSCPAFRDACVLGRIWLWQRGFDASLKRGGIGNFEWAATLALLLRTGGGRDGNKSLISPNLGSIQLFRALLQFFALRDLSKQPLILNHAHFKLDDLELGLPMLFDGQRSINVLFKMTPASYSRLRQEAQISSKTLSRSVNDQFDSTFIIKVNEPLMQYDLICKVSNTEQRAEQKQTAGAFRNCLIRGLGDRATSVDIFEEATAPHSWSLESSFVEKSPETSIAFQLEPNNASRMVDRGPSVENKEDSEAFRRFWGEKAELRRFKDGQILYSAVWSSGDYISITKEIVAYLLEKYTQASGADYTFVGNDFSATRIQGVFTSTTFNHIIKAFRTFENDLRTLDGLPLRIRQVQPCHAAFRYSSTFVHANNAATLGPCSVIIQFEGSSRWPDDLRALQVTKVALLLKIQDLFNSLKSSNIQAVLAIENNGNPLTNQGYLDISYQPSGITFRVRIYQEREEPFLERRLQDKSISHSRQEEAADSLAACRRSNIKSPIHTQALQNLATRLSALSGTIRLVKLWFNTHLLFPLHFTEETIEIIVARTFVEPQPWQIPSSPMTGFLRTLLFLSRWEWQAEPLIVDLGEGSMTKEQLETIKTRYEAWRKIDPSLNRLALFIATNVDSDGATWTDRNRPSKVIAGRMSSLAKAAIRSVSAKALNTSIQSLFKSPLTDYDFCLHLSSQFTDERQNASKKYKNLGVDAILSDQDRHNRSELIQNFVLEIQTLFGDSAMFFYGVRDSKSVVTGLWAPRSSSRKWKVNIPYSTMPNYDADDQIECAEINKDGILSEISRIGGDLVQRVEVING